MRVLVTGSKGQLGYDVCKRLSSVNIEYKGIDRDDCDLTDNQQVQLIFQSYKPDTVIHCAAFTAVDKAESQEEFCRNVNVNATHNIAEICKMLNAKMIYISTDYVFDGKGDQPFEIDSLVDPQNVYGKTKADGETGVRRLLSKYFIVRTSWVFGYNGNNFVKTMLRISKVKDSINVVNDQIGSPTYTFDLAILLCDMVQTEKYGVYHATNESYCSWAEFADEIMKLAKLECKVNSIPTSEYVLPATRPLNSRLSKQSLDDAGFSRLPSWQDALKRYMVELTNIEVD